MARENTTIDPDLKNRLHGFRIGVDACIQDAGRLKLQPNQEALYADQGKMQREITLVYTKLQEAKMWVGQCLEQICSGLPLEFGDKAGQ